MERQSAGQGVRLDHIDDVTRALAAVIGSSERGDDLPIMLKLVSEHAVRVVPGVDMVSVTLLNNGLPETAACTDDVVLNIDADQHRTGAGPCIEAASTGKTIRVKVTEAERLWPDFVASARSVGVHSYLCAPLVVDSEHAGALSLYGLHAYGFLEIHAALVELYTTAVEAALAGAARYLAARDLAAQLRSALDSRAVIDQAKGILMAVHRITEDEAFRLLVERSQREQRKLREVAVRFVAESTGARTD